MCMAKCCRGLTVDLQFDLGYSVFMTSPWVAMEDINFKDKIFMIGKYIPSPPPKKILGTFYAKKSLSGV